MTRKTYSKKIPPSVACLGLAVVAGLFVLEIREHSQKAGNTSYSVRREDLNHDGLEDVVVSTADGIQEFFLQQKDGSYHRRFPDYKSQRSSASYSPGAYNPGFN